VDVSGVAAFERNCDRKSQRTESGRRVGPTRLNSPMSGEGRSPNSPTDEGGGQGPDGGVDLGLTKNGQRYLVQCKHWRKRQVGVTVVRELNGFVSAQGAHGGFVVTGGEFSREAREFADSCGIKLIDGPALEDLIGDMPRRNSADSGVVAAAPSAPGCPRCGLSMVERKAKQGKFVGKPFWGCQQYPKCSGIVRIS
jgi:restriction system protein